MNDPSNILLVEDHKGSRVTLTALLEEEGYKVDQCETAADALNLIATSSIEIVVSDLKLPDGSGLQILWSLKKLNPDADFILITGHATVETAIEAVNQGAFAYHVKPLDTEALLSSVRQALKKQQLVIENRNLLEQLQQALEEVQHMNSQLTEKNMELERVSLAKTQILATVTHELKTPLTCVMGYVDRLLLHQDKVGQLNERQKGYLDIVQSNSRHLQTLIEDLLDISRIESGSLQIAFEDLQAGDAIGELVQSMAEVIDQKQLRVIINIPSDLSPIRANKLRFSQITSNLLSNACKYSSDRATIAVTGREIEDSIQFDFADTGIGISSEDQTQLFTKFFRSDNSSTRSVSGIGLGLFITKHLVEAQGGEIWVQSQPGKGSTFSFTLPKAGRAFASDEDIGVLDICSDQSSAPGEERVHHGTLDQAMNGGSQGVHL